MAYVNHIVLGAKGVKRNRRFLRLMYGATGLEEMVRRFDFLDCEESWARQRDPDMTVDRFEGLITRQSHIVLQLNWPRPEELNYFAEGHTPDGIQRMAWVEGPCTDQNFSIIAGLYRAAFNIDLTSEPAEEYMRQRYEQLKRLGYRRI
jgi:hypothetical protein